MVAETNSKNMEVLNDHGPVWARWNMIDIPLCIYIYILHTLWFSNIKRGNWKSPIKVYSWEHHLQMVDFPASHAWGPRRVFLRHFNEVPGPPRLMTPKGISMEYPLEYLYWYPIMPPFLSNVSWLSHNFWVNCHKSQTFMVINPHRSSCFMGHISYIYMGKL